MRCKSSTVPATVNHIKDFFANQPLSEKMGRRKKSESQETCQIVFKKNIECLRRKDGKIMKNFLLCTFLFLNLCFSAQEKVIDTVVVYDNQLKSAEKTQSIIKLNREDLEKNSTSLSEVLRFQSPVYIKENGRGAVSSPSFRGTSSQQTAFIWNGLNINSMFLGQGDINNLGLLDYDEIDIKSGGGSVIYGSAAIGGTIHLNNQLKFNKGFHQKLFAEYASFDTFNSQMVSSFSSDKLSVKFAAGLSKSKNDYEVPERDYINRNGQYNNKTVSLEAAYKINNQNQISWLTQFFDGSQNFPIFDKFGTKTKYLTNNTRNLLSWEYTSKKIINIFRLAYLEENFTYFGILDQPKSSGGKGKNYIAKNDFTYFFIPKLNVNIITDYKKVEGEGYGSGIDHPVRKEGSAAVLLRYQANNNLYFEAGVKKDFVEQLKTPVLYSFGTSITFTEWYQLKINASKNFRYPSFNDLYWQPGGNLDLKSETAYQGEMSNNFKYKNIKLNVMPYYIYIENMIRWLPTSQGFWSPVNTNKVRSYGLESSISYQKNWQKMNVNLKVGYDFTKSENLETNRQLSYVPMHKVFGNVDFRYSWIKIYAQGLYNGLTFTSTDEDKDSALKAYLILNAGISVNPFKHYTLGFKINNITDKVYETTRYYVLPKRNYAVNLSLNF